MQKNHAPTLTPSNRISLICPAMHPELSGRVCTYAINLSGLNEISGVRYCLVERPRCPNHHSKCEKGGGEEIESDSLSLQFNFISFLCFEFFFEKKVCYVNYVEGCLITFVFFVFSNSNNSPHILLNKMRLFEERKREREKKKKINMYNVDNMEDSLVIDIWSVIR